MAKLINLICEQGMIFCFTTMKNRQIVEAGLKAHPMVASVMRKYAGTHLFIIDCDEVHLHGGKNHRHLNRTYKQHTNFLVYILMMREKQVILQR